MNLGQQPMGYELPQDITLEEAAMLYDTIAEGIRANLEDAKAESKAEGKAELLTDVVAHMFPEQTDAFQQYLTSRSPEAWPDMSALLSWTGTGDELMEWLDGQESS